MTNIRVAEKHAINMRKLAPLMRRLTCEDLVVLLAYAKHLAAESNGRVAP